MDKITKALRKLSSKEAREVRRILRKIKKNNAAGLNVKKLKGKKDIFRVRKGDIRIIFSKQEDGNISILVIERRSENTYGL